MSSAQWSAVPAHVSAALMWWIDEWMRLWTLPSQVKRWQEMKDLRNGMYSYLYVSEMGLVFWDGAHTQLYTCSVWEKGGGASTAACYGESGSSLQKTGTPWVSLRRRNLASFRWELLLVSVPEVYGWVTVKGEKIRRKRSHGLWLIKVSYKRSDISWWLRTQGL